MEVTASSNGRALQTQYTSAPCSLRDRAVVCSSAPPRGRGNARVLRVPADGASRPTLGEEKEVEGICAGETRVRSGAHWRRRTLSPVRTFWESPAQ